MDGARHKPVDYSRWDAFEDDDRADATADDITIAAEVGRNMLAGWLREASLSSEAVARAVDFIELQRPDPGHTDNRSRYRHIIDDLESRPAPQVLALLRALSVACQRDRATLQPGQQALAARVSG